MNFVEVIEIIYWIISYDNENMFGDFDAKIFPGSHYFHAKFTPQDTNGFKLLLMLSVCDS